MATLMGLFSMLHNFSLSVLCSDNVRCLDNIPVVMVKQMNSEHW